MTLAVQPKIVREDTTALIIFSGPANRSVAWTLTGAGTLTPLSSVTDHAGQAAARYTPAGTGTVTVSVEYGVA